MKKIKSKLAKLREYLSSGSCKCKSGCFECCTKIFFTDSEKQRMDQSLRERGINEPPNAKGDDYCEYLNENGQCSVYEERPIVCRAFGVVDTPFCFCDKTSEERRIKETEPLKHYLSREMKFNKGYKHGDEVFKKIKEGDPSTIAEVLYHSITLFNLGKISKDRLLMQYRAFNEDYITVRAKNLHDVLPEFKEYFNAIKND